ncbi:hypothetical protein [Pedobacter sp.]|uniref:hypothetical protein n=1 Tax=Pedobacter sp. TaxID=1411316 RepID=UPI003BAC21F7
MDNLQTEIDAFKEAFCPYGYLDVDFAVREAISAGFDGEWAFKTIDELCEDCGIKYIDIDPCFAVMDSILKHARNEIDSLTHFDICNDADFSVYGNFMASYYESNVDDAENLTDTLMLFKDSLDDFSDCTRYWLLEIGIDLTKIQEK